MGGFRCLFRVLIIASLAVAGCATPPVPVQLTATPTPSPPPTATLTPTPAPFPTPTSSPTPTATLTPTPSPSPTPALTPAAERALLSPMSHEYQKLNNCGPVALAMALSYYGLERTQFDIAPLVKGHDKDKHVSPEEMVAYLAGMGLGARVRVNGNAAMLKALISNGIPVIVQQLLLVPDGRQVGHYRLVRGYDGEAFVVNDPYKGPKLRFSFALFDERWRAFNRRYIPVYPPEREEVVRAILGEDWDDGAMYERALAAARREVESVGDAFAWFNLGDDYLALGEWERAVEAYERALELGLPPLFLWYQYGPFEAYNALGRHERVLALSEGIVAKAPDIEEIRYQRGLAYLGLGDVEKARAELELAVKYNPRYAEAREALAGLK